MKNLTEVRAELKKLGPFSVKTKTSSIGRHATYHRDGQPFPTIFFDDCHRQRWMPLINWIEANKADLKKVQTAENIKGLVL